MVLFITSFKNDKHQTDKRIWENQILKIYLITLDRLNINRTGLYQLRDLQRSKQWDSKGMKVIRVFFRSIKNSMSIMMKKQMNGWKINIIWIYLVNQIIKIWIDFSLQHFLMLAGDKTYFLLLTGILTLLSGVCTQVGSLVIKKETCYKNVIKNIRSLNLSKEERNQEQEEICMLFLLRVNQQMDQEEIHLLGFIARIKERSK